MVIIFTKDYCGMDEHEELDYYLFCDTQIHKGVSFSGGKLSISVTRHFKVDGKSILFSTG